MGNHTESLQIDFDPSQISYGEILTHFWQSHDPTARAWSAQYKAALFVHDPEQATVAEASKEELAETKKGRFFARGVQTEILPAETFYLAEEYHQKYMLRRATLIWDELMQIYPSMSEWLNSTAVARLNGYVSGYGNGVQLQEEIHSLGLSTAAQENLRQMVRGRW